MPSFQRNPFRQIFGNDRGLLVALGAVASVGYVVLLEKTADDVASGKRDILTKLKGDARFAMPVLLIAIIALKNYITNPDAVKLLNLIPKDDFATAHAGIRGPVETAPLVPRDPIGSHGRRSVGHAPWVGRPGAADSSKHA